MTLFFQVNAEKVRERQREIDEKRKREIEEEIK
jgi:hypothetical protein